MSGGINTVGMHEKTHKMSRERNRWMTYTRTKNPIIILGHCNWRLRPSSLKPLLRRSLLFRTTVNVVTALISLLGRDAAFSWSLSLTNLVVLGWWAFIDKSSFFGCRTLLDESVVLGWRSLIDILHLTIPAFWLTNTADESTSFGCQEPWSSNPTFWLTNPTLTL